MILSVNEKQALLKRQRQLEAYEEELGVGSDGTGGRL